MSARFATTQWSQVLAARDGSESEMHEALESLCQAYWYPIYAYVRRRGHEPDEAADLTQGFFAQVLDKRLLDSVDQEKGSFRAFLVASLRNYLSHERDKAQALKRGGGISNLSLDTAIAEGRYRREPVETSTPESIFERRWALTLMERAMGRLEDESKHDGGDHFERLRPYLTGSRPSVPYQELAGELGKTEGAIKTSVYRLRQRYGHLLREEVAATLADPSRVDEELRHLLAALQA